MMSVVILFSNILDILNGNYPEGFMKLSKTKWNRKESVKS